MKRMLSFVLSALFLSGVTLGEDAMFNKVKVADPTGKQVDAHLVFSDANKNLVVRLVDRDLVTVNYDQVDKFSYEYTKKHRLSQAVALGMISPGTGIIVAFTKSKNHWLDIDFHDQNAASTVVLKLDKSDYQKVCDAAKTHTGKEVLALGKTSTQSIKAKITN